MKLHKHLFVLLFYLVVIFFIGCEKQAQQNQNIVAEIGDNSRISFTDLQKFAINYFYNKRCPDKSKAYNKALDEMVTNQLKRIDFFERGLYNNKELIQSISRIISEELIVSYFNTQFLGKYTSDEYIRKTYENMGKEVVYRQIVLYKPKDASPEQIDLVRTRATEIKTKIDEGKDFGELVHQYSQHAESVNEDGYMPPITWKISISNPLYNVLFNLNVGDVRILESYQAYYIVNITGINKIDVEPFDKIKDDIVSDLEKGCMELSLKEYDDAKKELIDESSLEWNQKALNKLVEWSKVHDFYKDNYKDILQRAISNGKNFTILKHSKGEVDLKEYLRLLDNILIPKSSVNISIDDIKNYILEAVRTDIMVKKAKELNLEKDLFNPNTTSSVMKNRIVWLYNQAVIESQIPEGSDIALQEFYKTNKDSSYYQLAKVNMNALIFSEKEKADKLWSKIEQGVPFNEVSDRWFVKTFVRDRDGKIKSYLSKEEPFLGEAAFRLKESEVDGVVEYSDPEKGKQYAIIKCSNKRLEKQLTYNDVKNSIADDFKNYHRQQIKQEVSKNLRKKHKVIIYENVLSKEIASASM